MKLFPFPCNNHEWVIKTNRGKTRSTFLQHEFILFLSFLFKIRLQKFVFLEPSIWINIFFMLSSCKTWHNISLLQLWVLLNDRRRDKSRLEKMLVVGKIKVLEELELAGHRKHTRTIGNWNGALVGVWGAKVGTTLELSQSTFSCFLFHTSLTAGYKYIFTFFMFFIQKRKRKTVNQIRFFLLSLPWTNLRWLVSVQSGTNNLFTFIGRQRLEPEWQQLDNIFVMFFPVFT